MLSQVSHVLLGEFIFCASILMVEWFLVQVNKTLLWLSLGGNWIGAEGVWALAESLRHNSSLQWLGLGGNDLGDRGALHLASLLQGNLPFVPRPTA